MALVTLNLAEMRHDEMRRAAEERRNAPRVAQALNPTLFSMGPDSEDANFRRITSKSTTRDLNPLMQERMQQVCYYLAATTPFGKRIVEIITSYTVGEGFKASCEQAKADAVVKKFWTDPINRMDGRLRDLSNELVIFGEILITTAVNPIDGSVRLGYVDPTEIDAIEYGQLATSESELGGIAIPVTVRLKQRVGESQGRRLAIIRYDEDVNSPTFGRLTGECFYFKVNAAQCTTRGLSELFSLADWIDLFDQMIFDFGDKARMLNSLLWHYTVTGGDEKAVRGFKEQITKQPPKQGGVLVTNDQIKIEAQTPDFRGADMHETARMVKLYGLGGAGLPAWFFADPVDSNRAIAQEMSGPTGKKLTDWQNKLKEVMTAVLNFVLDQAIAKGVLPEKQDPGMRLTVPDLSVQDSSTAATTLQTVANAAALGEDRGWIRAETAARAFHTILSQIGIEVDTAKEFDQAQQEKANKDAQGVDAIDPQKNLADALKNLPAAGAPAALPQAPAEGVVQ